MDPWAPYLSISMMQFLRHVGPWLRRLWAALVRLALAFLAVAPAALSLSFAERLQPGDELGLPSCEVSLNTAVFAFHHVAVALPSGHHPMSTEHPEPLVHVLPHLWEKGTGEWEQPSGSEDARLRCDSWGFHWGTVLGGCWEEGIAPSKGLRGTDAENGHMDTMGEGERGELGD